MNNIICASFAAVCSGGNAMPLREDSSTGDLPTCYADPAKSAQVLGWKAEKNLEDMCRDSWRWQSRNPMGYAD